MKDNEDQKQAKLAKINSEPKSTVIHFPLPEVTPEFVEHERRIMAAWWGVPIELVELVENCTIEGKFWPAWRLAPGWKFEKTVERVDENTVHLVTRVVKAE